MKRFFLRKKLNIFKPIICSALVISILVAQGTVSRADTIDQLKARLRETQSELNALTGQELAIEGKKDAVEEEIAQLDANIMQIMSAIEILGEDIAAKQVEVQNAARDLEAAMDREQSQYDAMKIRIRFMYEHGEYSYLQLLLESRNISDLMNKADYIERLYEYDRQLLLEYQQIVEEVSLLKERLEEEQSALEAQEHELREEQEALEAVLEEKRDEISDYDAQIAQVRSISSRYTALVRQQTNQIKQLEAEEAARREAERKAREEAERKAREEAERKAAESSGDSGRSGESRESSGDNSGDSAGSQTTTTKTVSAAASQAVSMIGSAPGSSKGKEIANFACQFIGNPYVPGGTSLTNGADCSGFTQSVFKNFGISLPRNSSSQREYGTGVSYADAEPGDIVCYPGHVGVYIGNGYIVHASTQKTGIKISPATYRDILAVRRVL